MAAVATVGQRCKVYLAGCRFRRGPIVEKMSVTQDLRSKTMAEFMFMLFDSEEWYDDMTVPDWEQDMAAHRAFGEAVEAAGARILGGAALQRSSTATIVRTPEGKAPLFTDGPFIETKEALGGFYLIEAKDLDQALELAVRCPVSQIEVRPVLDTSEPP